MQKVTYPHFQKLYEIWLKNLLPLLNKVKKNTKIFSLDRSVLRIVKECQSRKANIPAKIPEIGEEYYCYAVFLPWHDNHTSKGEKNSF